MSKKVIRNTEDLKNGIAELQLDIPLTEGFSALQKGVQVGNKVTPNAIAIHPMEGADGELDGRPSELTFRRYKRFAQGGAGLIWMEAVAVVPEGRANPRQLYIHGESVEEFARLIRETKEAAREACGHEPLIMMQLTHSGRYSKPTGSPEPIIAYHNSYLDQASQLGPDYPVATDEYLEQLIDSFRKAARFAKETGVDGVDIKCCHGYLFSELLSAFDRPGRFGGDYAGRTRLLRSIVQEVHRDHGDDLIVGVRLNLYDGLPKPEGWGATAEGEIDFSEPEQLIKDLVQDGVSIFNATAGNPYYQPHINRPYTSGGYEPPEPPLKGIERLLALSREAQHAAGEVPVIGVGFSYLRSAAPHVAAAAVGRGDVRLAGFGRLAFAYPDFPKRLLENKELNSSQVCTACSGCTKLMRAGHITGCIIRDDYYRDLWRNVSKTG